MGHEIEDKQIFRQVTGLEPRDGDSHFTKGTPMDALVTRNLGVQGRGRLCCLLLYSQGTA